MTINRKKLAAVATIQLEVFPEDIPVRGNALASGDAVEDKAQEDEIIARLEQDDVWAWCGVRVVASYGGCEGDDYLGACCYADRAEFMGDSGYYADMVRAAVEQLAVRLEAAVNAISLLSA